MSIRLTNSCFVHVPRTGGTWIGEVLRQLGIVKQVFSGDLDGHLCYDDLPPNWRALKAFGFVRHPLVWLRSRWSHALEINACKDHRHYGIHRVFDTCVRPTIGDTVKSLLETWPGLISMTYKDMLMGVSRMYCTEDLPLALVDALTTLEGGIDKETVLAVAANVQPVNRTSSLPQYGGKAGFLSDSLAEEFMASEKSAMTVWEKAALEIRS